MNSFKIYIPARKFYFFQKREKGYLEGNLIFLDNNIKINDRVLNIDTVEMIHFPLFDDYAGKIINAEKVSEGVDNNVMLTLKSREKIISNFQLTARYQIRDIREQLVHYHNSGKLHFLNLIDILGIEDYNAIQIFKNSLSDGGSVKSY